MSEYVSEKLDISYSVPCGLIYMLIGLTKASEQDVWCELSNIATVCAERLLKKPSQRHSWTAKAFPNTEVELRIDMKKYTHFSTKKETFRCEVKFGRTKFQTFTQAEVNEYITESILLGVDDES